MFCLLCSLFPGAGHVIDAAGISTLLASLFFVLFTVFRFVRVRVGNQGSNSSQLYSGKGRGPMAAGWIRNIGEQDMMTRKKTPPPIKCPPKNVVFSESEDTDMYSD